MERTSKAVIGIVAALVVIGGIWYGVAREGNEGLPEVKEPIKIGFATPLTGDAAAWGLPAKRGAEIALDKVNAEGGISGRKLELIFEDDRCDGATAATIANKFINIDKVPAIVGPVCSSAVLGEAPIVEQNKVVLLSAGASAPAIRDAGEYVFSIYPLDNYEAGLAAEFAYENLSKRKAAILYANNDYGKGAKDVLEEKFKEKGGEIRIMENYLIGQKDFRAQLTKIKNSGADVLFIWGQPNEMVPILKQLRELGVNLQIITTSVDIETEDLRKAGPEIADEVIYTIFKAVSNFNAGYLRSEHQKRYGEDEDGLAPFGYDVVLLIADALRSAGPDADKIRDYLYTVRDFPGASGTMSFDEDGTVVKEFEFKTVKNGQFVPYGE